MHRHIPEGQKSQRPPVAHPVDSEDIPDGRDQQRQDEEPESPFAKQVFEDLDRIADQLPGRAEIERPYSRQQADRVERPDRGGMIPFRQGGQLHGQKFTVRSMPS
jgi:hypothetical protein